LTEPSGPLRAMAYDMYESSSITPVAPLSVVVSTGAAASGATSAARGLASAASSSGNAGRSCLVAAST
jgi:hypothetical protein